MLDFLRGIDGEGRFWLCLWAVLVGGAVAVSVCLTVYHTVTEIHTPNPHKWGRGDDALPTVKARLVPAE